jgi:hypothetical protein
MARVDIIVTMAGRDIGIAAGHAPRLRRGVTLFEKLAAMRIVLL